MKDITFCLLIFLSFSIHGQERTVGVVKYDQEVSDGYVLISSLLSPNTYLVNNCGNIVHEWNSNYYPGNTVRLMQNGNLLRATKNESINFNAGGAGGRIEIVDWDSNVLWEFIYDSENHRHHHDVLDLPNGNILILAWDARGKDEAIASGRNPQHLGNVKQNVWGEHILEIKPVGSSDYEIVWEWYLWDHLVQDFDETKANFGVVSTSPNKININYDVVQGNPDWIHANGIEYNEQLDQIIISSKNLNELWVIDHSTSIEEAKTGIGGKSGKGGDILFRYGNPIVYDRGDSSDQVLFGQHNPQWANAAEDPSLILVFNDGNGRQPEFSSVDFIKSSLDYSDSSYTLEPDGRYNPTSPEKVYKSIDIDGFEFSSFLSSVQELENGNLFICSGAVGNIVEIDKEGNTLWNYISPITSKGIVDQGFDFSETIGTSNLMFRAYKYPVNYVAFKGKSLVPTILLEKKPLPSLCNEVTALEGLDSFLKLYPVPAANTLNVDLNKYGRTQIEIWDSKGNVIEQWDKKGESFDLDISNLDNGLFFIKVIIQNKVFVNRILKIDEAEKL